MIKQKQAFQTTEKQQQLQIEDDLSKVSELQQRVEHSSKAMDKITKENLVLRKANKKLEQQIALQQEMAQKKAIQTLQEQREAESEFRKKIKKLQKIKKE